MSLIDTIIDEREEYVHRYYNKNSPAMPPKMRALKTATEKLESLQLQITGLQNWLADSDYQQAQDILKSNPVISKCKYDDIIKLSRKERKMAFGIDCDDHIWLVVRAIVKNGDNAPSAIAKWIGRQIEALAPSLKEASEALIVARTLPVDNPKDIEQYKEWNDRYNDALSKVHSKDY